MARNVKFMAIINPQENEDVRFDLTFEPTEEAADIVVKGTVLKVKILH